MVHELPICAYLDTNVLGNWFLHYRKPRTWQKFEPKDRAKQTMIFHQEIQDGKYRVRFQTSSWATSELAETAMDYRLGVKMIREGRNPELFNKWKRQYVPMDGLEANEIKDSLKSFLGHIKRLGVRITESKIDPITVHEFILRYGLDAPDATHLSIASMDCSHFITNDEELCRKDIKEIEVVLPATFGTMTVMRKR